MYLNYSLESPQERIDFIETLLEEYDPSPNELNLLTDYALFIRDKNQTKVERKEEYPITTPNRELTIDKRQISYEGLIEKLENGEDGLYSLINENKEFKLDNKEPLTQHDIETIPGIQDSLDIIKILEEQYEKATGVRRKNLKTTIIEMWKQIYMIKGGNQITLALSTNKTKYLAYVPIPEDYYFDENDIPKSDDLLSLLNPKYVSFLLQHYQPLKEESWDLLESDMRWHLIDLENYASAALEEKYPILWDILVWKVDRLTNKEIKEEVLKKYGEKHSEQYYSSVWRNRIPKLITEEVQKQYLIKYCRQHHIGYWKRCSKCGKLKLGHPLFYNKNSSKDKYYSQCKECRSKNS